MKRYFLPTLLLLAMSISTMAQDIKLPLPARTGGKPLMQALNDRSSSREYDTKKLSPQQLSDLLWASWGINRPDGKRTAPSSRDRQEMMVYAAMETGLYLYVPESNLLKQVHKRDIRKETGLQDFVWSAPLNLVYVADLKKAGIAHPETVGKDSLNTSYINTGFMAQNVYLYCASAGLACVVRANFDMPALAKAMELDPEKRIIITQTVGYPKK